MCGDVMCVMCVWCRGGACWLDGAHVHVHVYSMYVRCDQCWYGGSGYMLCG